MNCAMRDCIKDAIMIVMRITGDEVRDDGWGKQGDTFWYCLEHMSYPEQFINSGDLSVIQIKETWDGYF